MPVYHAYTTAYVNALTPLYVFVHCVAIKASYNTDECARQAVQFKKQKSQITCCLGHA